MGRPFGEDHLQAGIASVEDLARQNDVKYGIQGSGSTQAFFDHSLKLYEKLGLDLNFNIMLSQRGVLTLATDEEPARYAIVVRWHWRERNEHVTLMGRL